jgi:hypothetical protein
MDKKQLISIFGIVSYLASQAAAQTLDELLYPLCKFDYDLMWIILVVAPLITAFLLVYNGVKMQSDNQNTRESAKKGIKNALIGLILIIAFSAIGCMFLPVCVPCPFTPYLAPTNPAPGTTPLNVWIIDPVNGASFELDATNTATVDVECQTRYGVGAINIIWNFNDPYGKTPVVNGGTTASYDYTEPGEYTIMVTAIDSIGNTAQHRIKVRIKGKPVTKPPIVVPPSCSDGVKNGDETDIDCGGTLCLPCPGCSDGIKNGDETGIDCGGPDCPACQPGCTNKPSLVITGIRLYNGATQVFPPLSPGTYTVEVDYSCDISSGSYNLENVIFEYYFAFGGGGSGSLNSYNCLNGPIGSSSATVSVVGGEVSFTYSVKADIVDLNGPQNCGNTNKVWGPGLPIVIL